MGFTNRVASGSPRPSLERRFKYSSADSQPVNATAIGTPHLAPVTQDPDGNTAECDDMNRYARRGHHTEYEPWRWLAISLPSSDGNPEHEWPIGTVAPIPAVVYDFQSSMFSRRHTRTVASFDDTYRS